MADLVSAPLQRRNPSGDEGGDEVLGLQFILLDEVLDVGDVPLKLSPRIIREVLLVELLDWNACSVIRQVNQINRRILVLHVELASEPFLDRSEPLHAEELGILPRFHLGSSN